MDGLVKLGYVRLGPFTGCLPLCDQQCWGIVPILPSSNSRYLLFSLALASFHIKIGLKAAKNLFVFSF